MLILVLVFNRSFFDQLLTKFRGRTEAIMEKDASTLEGAKDYYNASIQKKESAYVNASDLYKQVVGKLEITKKKKFDTLQELSRVEQQIYRCLEANLEEDARIYAEKKVTLEKNLQVYKDTIADLTQKSAQQKEIADALLHDLNDLKEEKARTLCQMEADEQRIMLSESMEDGIGNNENDRMLEKVREGARKKREMAEGARVAYEHSEKAAQYRLKERERESETDQVLNAMKFKLKK